MGIITFTPWRLLALTLALPLGVGAVGTQFFYESPKFLVNVQRDDEAIDNLRKIWKRNRGKGEKYPVSMLFKIYRTFFKSGNTTGTSLLSAVCFYFGDYGVF